jgi:colanic acid/amylovoran biosynthesis glycosyltransferase
MNAIGKDVPLRVDIAAYDDDQAVSGPVSWATRIPALLRQRGFQVRVLLLNWGCGEQGLLWRSLNQQGVPCETREFRSTQENTGWFLNRMIESRPQAFICNHVIPGLLIGGQLRRIGIPSVGILRSDDFFYHGIADKFADGRPQDRLSACVGVSEYLSGLLKNKSDDLLVRTIPSGTPLGTCKASWQSGLRLVYTGRLVQEQKRIYETTQALIDACREVPGTSAMIIGEGPEEQNVRAMVAASAMPIRVTGRMSPEQARECLLQSQIHVLFSDYEGLPTSVLEAMSCGVVPVCTMMRSGVSELIRDGLTGFLVQEPVKDLVKIVRLLGENQALWEQVSENARQHVQQSFSVESVAEKWDRLLRTLVGNAEPSLPIPCQVDDLCPVDERFMREDVRLQPEFSVPHGVHFLRLSRRLFRRFLGR